MMTSSVCDVIMMTLDEAAGVGTISRKNHIAIRVNVAHLHNS